MRTIQLFNSWGMKKETFVPQVPGKVSIYCCGPTVYSDPHIGNFRPVVTFDVLRRLFIREGYQVTFVSNYTDVDDKIIQRAKALGITEQELTTGVIAEYRRLVDAVGALQPDYTPTPTVYMPQIISYVEDLVNHGSAYVADGDVYLSVRKIPGYGSLSGNAIEDLESGARIALGDKKQDPLDFALWKKTDEGIQFDSPWSKGRPGWHTECVVMINDIFGRGNIDIHGGGHDLKFPHHENEIAQSEAFSHTHLANYWVHNQMININGEKMSKSLGNVLWAKDLLAQLGTNVYKWLMLSTHYRNPLNFTDDVLANVKKEVSKVENVVRQASLYLVTHKVPAADYDKATVDHMVDALSDDLNTSLALTEILDQVKVVNSVMRVKDKDDAKIATAYATLMKMQDVMGFAFKGVEMSDEDIDLYNKWQALKKEKNFEEADKLRATLTERGIL